MKPLVTYFLLAYLISWIIWFPLYAPAAGIEGLPVLPFHHAIGGLGPLIAAMISTWRYEKRPGILQLFKQMRQGQVVYLLIALLSPFLLAVIASLLNSIINGSPVALSGLLTTGEYPAFGFAGFFLFNLVFFGFGEETGWRGFALPRLQTKFNALTASLILTIFWALWHLPLFFYRPGFTGMDVAGIFGWVFSLLTGSILLTWFYNSSKGSILVCAIFHATVDIAFLADFADKNTNNYMGMLITIWGIAIILFYKPKHLSAKEKIVR
ncbi:type II CAAX endopeptidase family protein [Sediminibacterium ginsengisoli]|uniref:CAAX protease self-immunity n=1 Tax=Sediminibacterium ginsengisoli TaxID=413434 RepID=A0A1T4PGJ2_9BACT|nr:type II CAAX endopeptidase family protein [Sediminibacterium ginsengisoli]SJZ90674.1 CAAX protease self-immunity [Sediminibacterium ginsengisoli]